MRKFLLELTGLLVIEGIAVALLLGVVGNRAQRPNEVESAAPQAPALSLPVPRATLRASQSTNSMPLAAGSS